MQLTTKALLLSLACAATAPAFAYDAGNVIVRAGLADVMPDVKTDPALKGIDVDNNVQLGVTATYMVNPKFGVELLAATPFKHDITANGTKIGSTQQLPPTLSAQFYPIDNATIQPYVGIGINYTLFFNEKLNATGKAATGANSIKLSDSVGAAIEAGVDIKINDKLIVNASVWKADINTDVSLDGTKTGKIQIDPLVAMVGVGYRF
ncbi:MAG TPA: OmpW family outer membrane protein [Moraxellaceae bacterium]|nr:OmpW family outer membrane protein [Moraxellaceae bacterium]